MAEANIKRRFIAVLPFSPFAAFIERAAGRIREDALQHPNAHATFMDKSYGQIGVNGDHGQSLSRPRYGAREPKKAYGFIYE
jgi:hypothetical protein